MVTPAQHPSPQAEWLDHLEGTGNYNRWIFRSIEPYLTGRILEVGCGTGTFSRMIAETAEHLTAMDLDEAFAARTKQRLSEYEHAVAIQGDATKSLPGDMYDTVVMLDVLEHIDDDAAMLSALANRLAPGGKIVLKVPAIAALHNSMDRAVGHHRRYSKQGLRSAASAAGLTTVAVHPFNAAGIPGWWLNGVLGKTVAPSQQIGGFDRLVPILSGLERLLPLPFGLSWITALGKP